jgi:hypothetical protein
LRALGSAAGPATLKQWLRSSIAQIEVLQNGVFAPYLGLKKGHQVGPELRHHPPHPRTHRPTYQALSDDPYYYFGWLGPHDCIAQ